VQTALSSPSQQSEDCTFISITRVKTAPSSPSPQSEDCTFISITTK
ncbi:uncharacterized, partial [Tachysurus ichikawai]